MKNQTNEHHLQLSKGRTHRSTLLSHVSRENKHDYIELLTTISTSGTEELKLEKNETDAPRPILKFKTYKLQFGNDY